MMSWRSRATVILAGVLIVVGCTRPEDARRADESLPPPTVNGTETTNAPGETEPSAPTTDSTSPALSTTSSTSAPTTTATTDTTPPATQSADTTTATTPPASPEDLVLTFDSIGPWRFGDRDVDVVPGLVAILGDPVDDTLAEFPVAVEGMFLDEAEEQSYVAPFGRTVCFADALCAQFGAGAPETLILTGWRLSEEASTDVTTEDGIAIGSTWNEHADTITIDPLDSCFQVGYADAGGIDVVLLSSTEPFASPNDAGDFVAGEPDPEQVTVIELLAGRHPTFVFADC
jgi:hypothetical protein